MRWPIAAIAAACFAGLLVSARALAQEKPPPAAESEEMRELRKQVQELSREVESLKRRLLKMEEKAEAAQLDAVGGGPDGFSERRANPKVLAKIALPEKPTLEQARTYVQQIIEATQGQNIFCETDPQVGMLCRVGPDNLEALLDALRGGGPGMMGTYHVECAVERLAGEQHRQMIIDALAGCHDLAKVVLSKGWEKDAAKVLVEVLRTRPNQLPGEWIQAVSALQDPATYEDLKDYFVTRPNRYQTYLAIRNLPGIDLAKAIDKAWENSQVGFGEWERGSLATVAVDNGHLDALDMLFNELGDSSRRYRYWAEESPRQAILKHIEITGTNEELAVWFNRNRKNLVWDPKDKVFRVKEPAAP